MYIQQHFCTPIHIFYQIQLGSFSEVITIYRDSKLSYYKFQFGIRYYSTK